MVRKSLLAVLFLAVFAGAACSRDEPKLGDQRGLAVTGTGSVVVRHQAVLVTLKGLGNAKARADSTRMAEQALAPMVSAARAAVPAATITVEDPTLRYATATVHMWQRAFVKLPDDSKAEAVLRAVFAACADRGLCGWDVELVPADVPGAIQAARKNAMDDARRRAKELATAAGVRMGPAFAIDQSNETTPGLVRLSPQPFTEAGLRAYAEEIVAARGKPAKATPLITLDVRFEILT